MRRLLRRQWEAYARYHQSRGNLLLHIFFVPMFLLGNLVLLIALIEGRWLAALGGVLATVLALALQGRGHRQESIPPEPFTGPGNALARILLEQWVTFPRFVLSGGWSNAMRRAAAG
jgi:hypothetical protein